MPVELSSAVSPPAADDHTRGRPPVKVVVYGDYLCPYCAKTEAMLAESDIGRAFRHFPVASKHPRAWVLACAAEAAGLCQRFWQMHDLLFQDQGHLDDPHLWQRARALGLDLDRFERDRRSEAVTQRVGSQFQSGLRAGVMTTPTLLVDGTLHCGVPTPELMAKLS